MCEVIDHFSIQEKKGNTTNTPSVGGGGGRGKLKQSIPRRGRGIHYPSEGRLTSETLVR